MSRIQEIEIVWKHENGFQVDLLNGSRSLKHTWYNLNSTKNSIDW